MLPLPAEATDALRLADWLELRAILADDGTSSLGDLERVLTRAAIFDERPDELELKLTEVSKELDLRAQAAAVAYPFTSTSPSLEVRESWQNSTYIFCLLLSYSRWEQTQGTRTYPARMFEALSTEVARVYISTSAIPARAVRFASPRVHSDIPKGFKEAVSQLCFDHLGEGDGWRTNKPYTTALRPQDGGLDIVAWRDWPDKQSSKMMLWGACATGKDWEDKTHDLMPLEFAGEYFATLPVTPILRAFFVPHRIPFERWDHVARKTGLVFERCRIASLVDSLPKSTSSHGNVAKWQATVLKQLRKS